MITSINTVTLRQCKAAAKSRPNNRFLIYEREKFFNLDIHIIWKFGFGGTVQRTIPVFLAWAVLKGFHKSVFVKNFLSFNVKLASR